ncbi:hypothetical protein MJI46_31735, partial [Salmonella enterica subsp. enterica serovar Cerro]|nr:hypothetical protein [Salmonella enterica subsp. enterica serovar Cerro]
KKINTLYDILVASPQWVEQHPDLKTIGDLHRAPAMVRLADGRARFCFYFCDGYAGTIAEDNAQWHRFLVKIRFICLTIANGANI